MRHFEQPASAPDLSAVAQRLTERPESAPVSAHRWRDLLRPVIALRAVLGLNATDLAILRAVLSFLPAETVSTARPDGHICFAGNAAIAERAGVGGDSTVNRAIRKLEAAGIVARRSSTNRKRYARRGRGGVVLLAYGIDLAPLLTRRSELAARLAEAEEADGRILILREECRALASKLPAFDVASREEARRVLRRKPHAEHLERLRTALLDRLKPEDRPDRTVDPRDRDTESERHIREENINIKTKNTERISFAEIKLAFPTLVSYLGETGGLSEIARTADILARGASLRIQTWEHCKASLGIVAACVVLGALLEEFGSVTDPTEYVEQTTRRIARGRMSLGALLCRTRTGSLAAGQRSLASDAVGASITRRHASASDTAQWGEEAGEKRPEAGAARLSSSADLKRAGDRQQPQEAADRSPELPVRYPSASASNEIANDARNPRKIHPCGEWGSTDGEGTDGSASVGGHRPRGPDGGPPNLARALRSRAIRSGFSRSAASDVRSSLAWHPPAAVVSEARARLQRGGSDERMMISERSVYLRRDGCGRAAFGGSTSARSFEGCLIPHNRAVRPQGEGMVRVQVAGRVDRRPGDAKPVAVRPQRRGGQVALVVGRAPGTLTIYSIEDIGREAARRSGCYRGDSQDESGARSRRPGPSRQGEGGPLPQRPRRGRFQWRDFPVVRLRPRVRAAL